jgi:hypothetical protein
MGILRKRGSALMRIRIRPPVAYSTSIALPLTFADDPDGAGSGTTVTGENASAGGVGPHNWRPPTKQHWVLQIAEITTMAIRLDTANGSMGERGERLRWIV